jgi:hypothetical protein
MRPPPELKERMMKTRTVACYAMSVMFVLPMGWAWAGYEGTYSTFYGHSAGAVNSSDNNQNTFFGALAGAANTSGTLNTFIGVGAGGDNTTGIYNTFLGYETGAGNITGTRNVFLGFFAGYAETGSNKLYIDTCLEGGFACYPPLIYGEFDNKLLKLNGVLNVRANGVAKSQLHFSQNDTDTGGWLTSVLDNSFFASSGARYDAGTGGWIQRSSDGNAVIAGSGGVGYRIFTHTGTGVGSSFTPTLRLHIDYGGQFGINTAPVAGDEIHTSSGAHLTSGGVWTDASSREYKENIRRLTTEEALRTLAALDPVRYSYKANPREQHVGFVAEDVPELVAREDRRSLAPMDIVAVLTKVVQEQKQRIEEQDAETAQMKEQLAGLLGRMQRLEAASTYSSALH